MSPHRHPLLFAVLAVLFGAASLGSGALHLGHALAHLEAPSVAPHAGEGEPDDSGDDGPCGLCLSLSQGRSALTSAWAPGLPVALALGRAAAPAPPCAPRRVALSPESPRAPPLG